ncbi:MAG: hypothetical protein ABI321_01240 [Polyangia bacterium]
MRAGPDRVAFFGGDLEVEVIPALGGKLSVLRRRGGQNVLLEPPDFAHRVADVDGAFDAHDTSGFDECFPTVAACNVGGHALPDHGQTWSRPARVTHVGSSLRIDSELPGARFSRTLRVHGSTLEIEYEAVASTRMPALWSSHPLLAVRPGMEILLPREVRSLFVEWSANGALDARVDWPVHDGVRLDVVQPPSAGRAHKLFTDTLTEGACALYDPSRDESLTFTFDPREVPCVGLWVCEGGWPTSRASKHYTVALEPCSGRPDSLADAVALGTAFVLEPEVPRRWRMALMLSHGRPQV